MKPTKAPCAKGFVESGKYCWAKHDEQAQKETECRACADHMGIDIRNGHATLDSEGWWTDNGVYRIDAYCRRTYDGVNIIPGPGGTWEYRGDCPPAAIKACPSPPPPSPSPKPSPSASPGGPYKCVIGPDGNYPVPKPDECPSPCWDDSLGWTGIALLGVVDVDPQGGIYLGKRYTFSATPHSKPPFCGHAPGTKCEQFKPQGGGCQDPNGPDFYMTLPGKWENEPCDKQSFNPWNCHHKPKSDETGPTTVCAVPAGEPPDSPKGRCVTVDVK